MSVKTQFSIKDLENLSGVKAHTIRIWEKRYNLLVPERSDTNIRAYDINNLQKLLNIALLVDHGHKISKLSNMSQQQVFQLTRHLTLENKSKSALNSFKVAMMNFDYKLFDSTYSELQTTRSFREIFLNVFTELLEDIGNLWMTNTITPAHEHFISSLIKQKLLVNIELIQNRNAQIDQTFVLFLPLNEIHELGLLYIHFELLLHGYRSIFLGPSVPLDSLSHLQAIFPSISFVSYLTVSPAQEEVEKYVKELAGILRLNAGDSLHILGRNTRHLEQENLPAGVTLYHNLNEALKQALNTAA
ncbi:MAG: MerR family transcriptional regulator [Flavobacteriales bacterium]